MEDFEQRIEKFEQDFDRISTKRDFKDFGEVETDFCNLVNEGTALRNYLVDNPNLCNENTYKILTNQSSDFSLLEDKYKFLEHTLIAKKMLLTHYNGYLEFLMKHKKYNQAIRIYNQLFLLTGSYFYKKEIANIQLKIYGQYDKCMETYKEIEPYMEKSPHFWWEFSEVYCIAGDYFNQISCIKKAVELEMEKMN